ncbi:glycosyltransferase family 39 protein [Bdellovibrio sp. NC01]|uniref:glycosyltransferase family 39 protein n=1 Tax=Bdellovibrio sp. NC01 TaxID=2220073 RepID=UPI0011584714|nr:glycosyltransferase family 39 protein [Bdellovibrio sp. NC01]QDK37496.1 hypothetical protein DOE51_07825 [Bdellovibrio sp. NC01]
MSSSENAQAKNQSRFSLFLFVGSLLIFVSTLWKRVIHIDDVWLAEYSYWLAKLGYVKSEAMRGFYEAETKLYVYHKLFNIEGAWVIKFFGFHPYPLKAISIVYLLLSGILLVKIYRRSSLKPQLAFLLLALFLSFFHTMNLGFTFRPEMHLVFWGLLSYLFLERYFDTSKFSELLIAGFVTGISIATHLNGVVFAGAGVLLLWCYRRWLAGFIFGVVATWGLIFQFTFDVRSLQELQQMFTQLTHWRDVATGKYGWDLIFRVFEEQSRYLHSPPEIIYSLMLLLLIVPTRKYLWANHRRLVGYTLLLSFCIAEVTHGNNTNYLMYAFPFLVLISILAFENLVAQGRKKLAWSAVLIFIFASWAYNLQEFNTREFMAPEYAKVTEFLPSGSNVLSPAHLMFSGLDKFRIQSFITYRDKVEAGTLQQSADALFAEAQKFNIQYVVVDDGNAAFFRIKDIDYGPFRVMSDQPSEKFKIYKFMK